MPCINKSKHFFHENDCLVKLSTHSVNCPTSCQQRAGRTDNIHRQSLILRLPNTYVYPVQNNSGNCIKIVNPWQKGLFVLSRHKLISWLKALVLSEFRNFLVLSFLERIVFPNPSDPQNWNQWFKILAKHQNHTCSLLKMQMHSPHSRFTKEITWVLGPSIPVKAVYIVLIYNRNWEFQISNPGEIRALFNHYWLLCVVGFKELFR